MLQLSMDGSSPPLLQVAGIVETTGNCDCHVVLSPSPTAGDENAGDEESASTSRSVCCTLDHRLDVECGALRIFTRRMEPQPSVAICLRSLWCSVRRLPSLHLFSLTIQCSIAEDKAG